VVVDTACLDNSCLIDDVKPKSKELGTQCKFVPTCHYCEKIGYIRPNCSSDKYVQPHKRHLSQEGKSFVLCKNANLKIAEPVKKHFSKRSQPTCHHCGVIGHIRPHCHQIRHQKPRIKKQEPKTGKSSSKLPSFIMLLDKSGNTLKGVLPHAVTVARMATSRPNTSERSLTSPRKFRSMKGLST